MVAFLIFFDLINFFLLVDISPFTIWAIIIRLCDKFKDLKQLVNKSQTPRGLNEQALRELRKLKFYNKLNISSNNILQRLKGK